LSLTLIQLIAFLEQSKTIELLLAMDA